MERLQPLRPSTLPHYSQSHLLFVIHLWLPSLCQRLPWHYFPLRFHQCPFSLPQIKHHPNSGYLMATRHSLLHQRCTHLSRWEQLHRQLSYYWEIRVLRLHPSLFAWQVLIQSVHASQESLSRLVLIPDLSNSSLLWWSWLALTVSHAIRRSNHLHHCQSRLESPQASHCLASTCRRGQASTRHSLLLRCQCVAHCRVHQSRKTLRLDLPISKL